MAEYMIRMADERGHIMEQVELGNSEGEVRERFAQQGFLVYWVKPKGLLSTDLQLPRRRKVKQDQFVVFNQQFVTLIHAGLPIIQSIELLMKRQRNPFFRSILQDVRDRVRGGELLSEAFAAQNIFPKVYTRTLHRVSAISPQLPEETGVFASVPGPVGGDACSDADL